MTAGIVEGDFLAVLGASGCGKTTLLRLIAGLEQPDAGTITRQSGCRVGYVFQDPALLEWRTVRANVALPLELGTGHVSTDAVERALSLVGMDREADLYPYQLSGGMRMRVALGRALVTEPDLLLLDEPFAALDELARVHLEEELRAMWTKQKLTIVLVTHSFSEAVFLADRIWILGKNAQAPVLDSATPLPKDRDASVRGTATFAEAVQQCRREFEQMHQAKEAAQ